MPARLARHQLAFVAAELRAQRKLEAVKWVKATLGIPLVEAKEVVDAVQASPPPPDPSTALAELVPAVAKALDAGRRSEAVRSVVEALDISSTEAEFWVDGFTAGRASPPSAQPAGVTASPPDDERPFSYDEPPR